MLDFVIILIGVTSAALFLRDIAASIENALPGCHLWDWFKR